MPFAASSIDALRHSGFGLVREALHNLTSRYWHPSQRAPLD
jgi:hypothetical protein